LRFKVKTNKIHEFTGFRYRIIETGGIGRNPQNKTYFLLFNNLKKS